MNVLLSLLHSSPEYESLRTMLDAGQTAAVSGVSQIARAHWIAALHEDTGRPVVAVCQDEMAASRLAAELTAFLGQPPVTLPSRELTFLDAAGVSREWEQRRLRILYDLSAGRIPVLVTTLEALQLRTIPKSTLYAASIRLTAGGSYDLDKLTEQLTAAGYTRASLAEGAGQFALRGGILDVFSPAHDQPVRAEFFGDELDAMGFFDPVTQRRTENCDEALLLPTQEALPGLHPGGLSGLCADLQVHIARQNRRKTPNQALIKTLESDCEKLENGVSFAAADRYLALIYPEFACAADYISQDAAVFFCDHGNLQRGARARSEEFGQTLDVLLSSGTLAGELCEFQAEYEPLLGQFAGRGTVYFDSFLAARYPETLPPQKLLSITARQLPGYGGSLDTAVSDLKHYVKNEYGCLVLCGGKRRGEILKDMLTEGGVNVLLAFPLTKAPQQGQILITDGSLPAGLEYPDLHWAILTEGQLLTRREQKPAAKRKKAATNRKKLESFTDLTPGDLVVHEHHGIGRYVGMEQMKVGGVVKDYVKIAYQGSDALYVPATQLDLVSKYIGSGGEDAPVRLNKLGGDQWQKAKARAKAAAKDLAKGLIQLYAARKRLPGFAFAADSPWQKEFEESFPYAETDDQLRCIAEIKRDMESPSPMERLLCGDVGFGKTEVALRAAMKCILDGKQVAILVPTTVLAQQHYLTAVRRFASFPVTIDVLSRFRTAQQQKKTLYDLSVGKIDLIIGTHKLLQKSVQFKDLGLLIIDEEQRFGVTHKERLKELSRGVDVLTLSATPIPRTLNMALSGLRDMSTIEEPPQDRYPVQTFVLEHNDQVVLEAIRRELARGGQVYYLHNRVETIGECAAKLKQQLGEDVSIAVAHGKMGEEGLSDVMQSLTNGDIQVLVCTTIIETGIDVPNVNTLIIEDADKFGLSQLHQLRGRVGRSSRHAYAYLTFRKGKVLSEVAEKRLEAIREYAEFGSGFKIAMRDLEIRGAGDLLGSEQSGHMMSVGYDMYLKLLEEAVLEEQGEGALKEPECTADLNITANIAKTYVTSGEQRMDLYRRMAAIRSQSDADDLLDEIVDRYGDPPKGVLNLIDVALLRARAAAAGITEISQKDTSVMIFMAVLDFAAVSACCAAPDFKGRIFFAAGKQPQLTVKLAKGEDALKAAQKLVGNYAIARSSSTESGNP